MIPHVRMNDSSIVIQLSSGPATITPYTYNYNKIIKLLPDTTDESDIISLLKTPDFPNGTFYLRANDTIFYVTHHSHDGTAHYKVFDGTFNRIAASDLAIVNYPTVGIYTSFDEIRYDFPELFI